MTYNIDKVAISKIISEINDSLEREERNELIEILNAALKTLMCYTRRRCYTFQHLFDSLTPELETILKQFQIAQNAFPQFDSVLTRIGHFGDLSSHHTFAFQTIKSSDENRRKLEGLLQFSQSREGTSKVERDDNDHPTKEDDSRIIENKMDSDKKVKTSTCIMTKYEEKQDENEMRMKNLESRIQQLEYNWEHRRYLRNLCQFDPVSLLTLWHARFVANNNYNNNDDNKSGSHDEDEKLESNINHNGSQSMRKMTTRDFFNICLSLVKAAKNVKVEEHRLDVCLYDKQWPKRSNKDQEYLKYRFYGNVERNLDELYGYGYYKQTNRQTQTGFPFVKLYFKTKYQKERVLGMINMPEIGILPNASSLDDEKLKR